MTIRNSLRRQLEELRDTLATRGIGVAPLVAKARRVGEYGECRAPGLYYECGGRVPVVVFAGEEPSPADLARYFPGGPVPMLIGGEADVAAL